MAAPPTAAASARSAGSAPAPTAREQQQTYADCRSFAAGQPVDPVHEVEQIDPPDPDEADRDKKEKVPRPGQDEDADRHGGGLRDQPYGWGEITQIVEP